MSPQPAARNAIADRFRRGKRDKTLAVVEGFHALKHALRFHAEILAVLCSEPAALQSLAEDLAPDIAQPLLALAQTVEPQLLRELAPKAPNTGVVALAKRREGTRAQLLKREHAPVVLLEQPRDLGNLGASVRVAAAAEAAGVLVTGRHDPWHPEAIRGSAGLHFALPVLWTPALEDLLDAPLHGRALVAMDPDGAPFDPHSLPDGAVFAFGSERQGLSEPLLAAADLRLSIPMARNVSSLNLATSVAVTLFVAKLCA